MVCSGWVIFPKCSSLSCANARDANSPSFCRAEKSVRQEVQGFLIVKGAHNRLGRNVPNSLFQTLRRAFQHHQGRAHERRRRASAFQQLPHQSPSGADAVFRRAQDQLFPVRYAHLLAGGGETANATRDSRRFRLAAQECGQGRARRQHGPGQREAGLDVVADYEG